MLIKQIKLGTRAKKERRIRKRRRQQTLKQLRAIF